MANRLDTYKQRLDLYYKAEIAILEGAQSYTLGSRVLTRADLDTIKDMITYLENAVDVETAKASGNGRNRVFGIIPRDI